MYTNYNRKKVILMVSDKIFYFATYYRKRMRKVITPLVEFVIVLLRFRKKLSVSWDYSEVEHSIQHIRLHKEVYAYTY